MIKVIIRQVSSVCLKFFVSIDLKHGSCLQEVVICHVVAARSVSIEMRGSRQIVLFPESHTILIIDESVILYIHTVRIGETELAVISLIQGQWFVVDEAGTARFRVYESLKLRHINQTTVSVVCRKPLHVVKLISILYKLCFVEEEGA